MADALESSKNALAAPGLVGRPICRRIPAPSLVPILSFEELHRRRLHCERLFFDGRIGARKFDSFRGFYGDIGRELHQAEQRALDRLALGTARRLELGLSAEFAALVGSRPPRPVMLALPSPAPPAPPTRKRPPTAAKSRKRAASFNA
jgi:hypothetical protein